MEWFSVEERLPTSNKAVLVLDKADEFFLAKYLQIPEGKGSYWYPIVRSIDSNNIYKELDVKYWMVIPIPPEFERYVSSIAELSIKDVYYSIVRSLHSYRVSKESFHDTQNSETISHAILDECTNIKSLPELDEEQEKGLNNKEI